LLASIIATLVSLAIAASAGIAVFLMVAFLPALIGQSGYMLVWGYLGIPLGSILGFAAFLHSINPIQRRVKRLFCS